MLERIPLSSIEPSCPAPGSGLLAGPGKGEGWNKALPSDLILRTAAQRRVSKDAPRFLPREGQGGGKGQL